MMPRSIHILSVLLAFTSVLFYAGCTDTTSTGNMTLLNSDAAQSTDPEPLIDKIWGTTYWEEIGKSYEPMPFQEVTITYTPNTIPPLSQCDYQLSDYNAYYESTPPQGFFGKVRCEAFFYNDELELEWYGDTGEFSYSGGSVQKDIIMHDDW
jgi:hypothetical protein